MLKRDIRDEDVIHLIETIISETDKPYINEAIDFLNKKHGCLFHIMKLALVLVYWCNDIAIFSNLLFK